MRPINKSDVRGIPDTLGRESEGLVLAVEILEKRFQCASFYFDADKRRNCEIPSGILEVRGEKRPEAKASAGPRELLAIAQILKLDRDVTWRNGCTESKCSVKVRMKQQSKIVGSSM